ncbi:MAG: hypothetical protein HYZ45_02415 [Burkholderiales bacterium]|nr:hypothetical protein [Burkholderiales bacterium]
MARWNFFCLYTGTGRNRITFGVTMFQIKKLLCFAALAWVATLAKAEEVKHEECKTEDTAASYVQSFGASFEAFLKDLKAKDRQREAALDASGSAWMAAGKLTKEDQLKIFALLTDSKEFLDLEKQKKPHLSAYMTAIGVAFAQKKNPPISACESAFEAMAALREIGKINQKQYDMMDAALNAKANAKK